MEKLISALQTIEAVVELSMATTFQAAMTSSLHCFYTDKNVDQHLEKIRIDKENWGLLIYTSSNANILLVNENV